VDVFGLTVIVVVLFVLLCLSITASTCRISTWPLLAMARFLGFACSIVSSVVDSIIDAATDGLADAVDAFQPDLTSSTAKSVEYDIFTGRGAAGIDEIMLMISKVESFEKKL